MKRPFNYLFTLSIVVFIWWFSDTGCMQITFARHIVKPGQVWVYASDNPYNPHRVTNTVLEVKDGYVLYLREDGAYKYTNSCGCDWFVAGSKRL